ncbi:MULTISPECIES: PAS domain S-box protein [Gammaproteobacteria]|uniref:PAS domain S-box protein n=1 Tax=Gammaproteobacteria TaxID=1236 RepID=UPI000DCF87E4|nr:MULTISPECIES: PAS domain S-box protein [Gammaproteobacteria]RTE86227.1 PAS domain S-box protein [Aliidiomarina sp. B3213]TCZ91578.1 PAS domain S-box protein [Lysobacter sp. N42]
MSEISAEELQELHIKLGILGAIDVGIVVIDRNFEISMWNDFMSNHSGLRPSQVHGRSLFSVATEIDEKWFRKKAERSFELNSRSFIIWEQRPFLFRFPQYRPVTGTSPYMFQNVTLLPLQNTRGEVEQLCIIVYDVTDRAESERSMAQLKAVEQAHRP